MNIQDWFPLGWTGWVSLQSKWLSRVFSNTTAQSCWKAMTIFTFPHSQNFLSRVATTPVKGVWIAMSIRRWRGWREWQHSHPGDQCWHSKEQGTWTPLFSPQEQSACLYPRAQALFPSRLWGERATVTSALISASKFRVLKSLACGTNPQTCTACWISTQFPDECGKPALKMAGSVMKSLGSKTLCFLAGQISLGTKTCKMVQRLSPVLQF